MVRITEKLSDVCIESAIVRKMTSTRIENLMIDINLSFLGSVHVDGTDTGDNCNIDSITIIFKSGVDIEMSDALYFALFFLSM